MCEKIRAEILKKISGEEQLQTIKDQKEKITQGTLNMLLNNAENVLKLRLFIDSLIEGARKYYGLYHQRKMDLIARLSTEWPKWGVGMDFFNNVAFPFVKNAIVQHFINLSESFDLSNTYYHIYIVTQDFVNNNKKLDDYGVKVKVNNQDIDNLVDLTYVSYLDEWGDEDLKFNYKINFENLRPALIKIIDGDVGIQALYTIFEGILRNSAKHGRGKNNDMEVKIILAENWDVISKLVVFPDGGGEAEAQRKEYYYILVSSKKDEVDDELLNQLKNFLSEEIIDETGKITPGQWGFKEMKICSAFVAGENAEDVNKKDIDFMWLAKSNGDLWGDGKERLVHIMKVPKPKYLLVWTDEEFSNKSEYEEYERYGIKFVNDLNPDKMSWQDLDYDFLVVDKEDKLHSIEAKGYLLPFRKIVLKNLGNFDSSDGLNKQQKLILFSYKKWIEKIKPPNTLKVGILLSGVGSRWKNIFIKPDSIEINFFGNPENFKNQMKNFNIGLGHHVPPGDFFGSGGDKMFYQYGTARDPFFSFFMSLNPSEGNLFLPNLVLLQFIESAITKILVIDERIAQSLINKSVIYEDEKSPMVKILQDMGIYITSHVYINGDSVEGLSFLKNQEKNFVQMDINNDGTIKVQFNNSGDDLWERIDIVFIHQTKFNLIKEKVDLEKEKIIENWRKRNEGKPERLIVIHSGRGKPLGEKPRNAPFLEFSTLEKYLIYEPSKFYLTQIAYAIKEKGDEG